MNKRTGLGATADDADSAVSLLHHTPEWHSATPAFLPAVTAVDNYAGLVTA